jgi:FlaG/FlaF family flagellin (archaellin)
MSNPKRNKERGVALIAVLIAIAITIVISGEFGTATTTDISAAANYRDQMRSHFLARSAQNLAELVVRIQGRLDNIKELQGQVQITDFADQLILPFCGGADEVRDMIGFSGDDVPGLGADIGTCGFNGSFTTEDDKINLNCANNPNSDDIIKSALLGLVYFQAYDPVFEEADAEGWRRTREEHVNAIIDYIDRDATKGVIGPGNTGGASEDYGYESLRDRYQPKNNYIDTLGEVKLARGVDDRFWTLFGDSMTIYGGCRVNIAAVSNPQLIAAILFLSAKNPNDPVIMDARKLFVLAGIVAKAKQMGETFAKLDDFVTFVKDPMAAVAALAGTTGMAGSAASQALATGLMPGEKIGLELDPKKLGTIATSGPRRTYRIEAYGEIQRKQTDNEGRAVYPPIRSTINGVWDTKLVPQNARKQPVPKGAWVFLRED